MSDGYLQTKIRGLEEKVLCLENETKKYKIILDALRNKIEKQETIISNIKGLDITKINNEINREIKRTISDKKTELIDFVKKDVYKYVDKTVSDYDEAIKKSIRMSSSIINSINETKLFERVEFAIELNRCLGGELSKNKILTGKDLNRIKRLAQRKTQKYTKTIG